MQWQWFIIVHGAVQTNPPGINRYRVNPLVRRQPDVTDSGIGISPVLATAVSGYTGTVGRIRAQHGQTFRQVLKNQVSDNRAPSLCYFPGASLSTAPAGNSEFFATNHRHGVQHRNIR